MKKWVLLFCALSMVIIINGCISKKKDEDKKILTIGVKADVLGFYPDVPTYESATMSVNLNIYESLIEFDEQYRVVPCLAETWGNPTPLVWRFVLRKGVRFHDGKIFTAKDVKYSLDLVLNNEDNVFRDYLSSVEEINIVDEYTVDIVTKKPVPVLITKLVEICILPDQYVEEKSSIPVGTGPYKFVEHVKEDYIKLERFHDYWAGKTDAEIAIFKIIEDDSKRLDKLLLKEIDIAETVPVSDIDKFTNRKDLKLSKVRGLRVMFLSFDFRKKDSYGFEDGMNPVANLKVRKAMYYAINENEIIKDIMQGVAYPASQFVSPDVFGYNPEIQRLPYDLEKAKILMKEAGYESGFEIEMDCTNNRYINDAEICERVAKYLADINIKVNLNIQPKSEFFPKIMAKETSFHLLGWAPGSGDGGSIFDFILRTPDSENNFGNFNQGFYSNPEIDKIADEISVTMDNKKRLSLMQKGFAIAAEDVVWIPLHIQEVLYGSTADIEWRPRSDVRIRLYDIKKKK